MLLQRQADEALKEDASCPHHPDAFDIVGWCEADDVEALLALEPLA
jgi:hypothetical protein